ncbi:cellulose binding domain-containing protein [Paractinoplanes durhamensis]|uniref:CBM2 domain-containing protein n=1 Tax=Paractinoplanes durhamensis TaxID=113563 RepID=A0ABQ3YYC2_9ACTN|nr:cellulose binding domain-containing protein [Actinoplanes durhamensis]GIE02578.1 hypothetical protein Adu01nite_39280 [Actinoplanes durhamensis]
MSAKHSARPLGPARIILSAATAVLVMLVVWIAVRAVGPASASDLPAVALPSASAVPLAATPTTSPTPTPSATSASAKPKKSRTPVAEKTSRTPVVTRTTRPAANDFSATVSLGANWDQGYVAMVRIKNTGDRAAGWTVTVSHSGVDDLRLTNTWNARGSQQGNRLTFTGGELAPGASFSFGYQVSKGGRGNARPSGCSVVGGKCGVS